MADAAIGALTAETSISTGKLFPVGTTTTGDRATAMPIEKLGFALDTASDPTTGNVTAAVGKLYHLDISGMTANRLFVLPDSAEVDDRIGLFIEVGDASFELEAATAASGSLLNGVDESGGSDEYRFFITNESCVFRCIKAGGAGDTDWIVEHDGRIPCRGRMYLDTTISNHYTSGSFVTVPVDTTAFDVGDCADLTNEQVVVRRAGQYGLTIATLATTSSADTHTFLTACTDPSGTPVEIARLQNAMEHGTDAPGPSGSTLVDVAAAAVGAAAGKLGGQLLVSGTTADAFGSAAGIANYIEWREIL